MRIVAWNCNGALRRKRHLLDDLQADVLVVQECEDPAEFGSKYRAWAGECLWVGDLRFKGLGIFARSGLSLDRLCWAGEAHRLFLPVRIGGEVDLIGVWTQATRPASAGYVGQFWSYLQANRERVTERTVFCGDFNSNQIWDKERQIGNHSQCVDQLGASGIVSHYHHAFGEAHGAETAATFYLYRKPERPYHIDYVFAHRTIVEHRESAIRLGQAEDWLAASDHVPLIADLQFADQ